MDEGSTTFAKEEGQFKDLSCRGSSVFPVSVLDSAIVIIPIEEQLPVHVVCRSLQDTNEVAMDRAFTLFWCGCKT